MFSIKAFWSCFFQDWKKSRTRSFSAAKTPKPKPANYWTSQKQHSGWEIKKTRPSSFHRREQKTDDTFDTDTVRIPGLYSFKKGSLTELFNTRTNIWKKEPLVLFNVQNLRRERECPFVAGKGNINVIWEQPNSYEGYCVVPLQHNRRISHHWPDM